MIDEKRIIEWLTVLVAVIAVLNMMLVSPPVSTWIGLIALVVIAVLFVLRVRLGGKWFE
jgi:hypothetical protein